MKRSVEKERCMIIPSSAKYFVLGCVLLRFFDYLSTLPLVLALGPELENNQAVVWSMMKFGVVQGLFLSEFLFFLPLWVMLVSLFKISPKFGLSFTFVRMLFSSYAILSNSLTYFFYISGSKWDSGVCDAYVVFANWAKTQSYAEIQMYLSSYHFLSYLILLVLAAMSYVILFGLGKRGRTK